jgi:minor extracellular serine protease Vpr
VKKSSAIVMTVLASACMAALAASQSPDGVQWLESLEPAPPTQSAEPVDESPQRWFVELAGAPTADGGSASRLRSEKQTFRSAARDARLNYIEHYAFDGLFNGFSVTVGRAQLGTLMRMPGVKAIYPVETIQMPETGTISPAMATAITMTGVDIAQNELGLDGTGIKVAVMDTGIDIDHPDFGGSGTNGTTPFPSARVVAGWDFVGDVFNADSSSPTYNPVPTPDANPDDCGGHGTHVAGIVGANGTVKGVAPNVQFGAYRVFGCNGSTTADIMIAAMERALADGMHVLNMSIGSTYQWPEYPTAKAASRLVNRRMVVVASAGNSGATGMYSTGAPSVGDKVISVASFDNTHVRQRLFTVSPDGVEVGYNSATGAAPTPTAGTQPLARTGTAEATADACSALPDDSLDGRVALVRRGGCPFHTKALNAQNAGAAGVVIYDNLVGSPLNITVAGTPAITVPVVAVSAASGGLLDSRIAAGPTSLTWTDQTGSFVNPVGGRMSAFSAYGMSPDLQLKPDIGAPGGAIYSAYPLERGGFATLSGTSMSAPHVAGAAALLLQAEPRTSSQQVRNILQNTARPQMWSGNPGLGLLEIVHRQGAGMLRIDDAITNATRVEPGKLSLGEGEAGPVTRSIEIENNGDAPVTYALSWVDAVSTGPNTFVPSYLLPATGVSFGTSNVTLEPGATAAVGVTFTPPALPAGSQYGGYLVLTPDDGSAVLRVPFAGYTGDYQARPVLTPTANGFPWLARLEGGSYFNQPDGATYGMAGTDIPFFLVHLDHQSRMLRMDVIDAGTGRMWRRVSQTEYLGRNSSASGFFAFSWDGMTRMGNRSVAAPDGRYVMRLSVLKALGDESNPAHWERWDSPVITIAR